WLTGTGVPTDDLGNDGDVYFDGDTGNAYLKEDGAWTLLGRFADHQVAGKDWYAYALDASFNPLDAVSSFTAGSNQVQGVFAFTGAGQSGRLAFKTVGGYFGVGTNLSAFSEVEVSASASRPAYDAAEGITLHVSQGNGGRVYDDPANGIVDLMPPSVCFTGATLLYDVLIIVDLTQVNIQCSGHGAASLSVTAIDIR